MVGGFKAVWFGMHGLRHRMAHAVSRIQGRIEVQDLIYVGLTILFFGLALAYIRGCEKLH